MVVFCLFGRNFGVVSGQGLDFIFVFVVSHGLDGHLWPQIVVTLFFSLNVLLGMFLSFLSSCGLIYLLSLHEDSLWAWFLGLWVRLLVLKFHLLWHFVFLFLWVVYRHLVLLALHEQHLEQFFLTFGQFDLFGILGGAFSLQLFGELEFIDLSLGWRKCC